jgi:predicted transposase YbfD/YdcC
MTSKLSPLFLELLEKKNHQKDQAKWLGLKTIVKIVSERKIKGGEEKKEIRYYLSSLDEDASKLLHIIRSHWGVENKLHWVLDTAFNEDSCRVRNGYAGENFAVIRQLAVNLLKQELTSKRSINGKRLRCSWINEYLYKVITGITPDNLVE